MSEATPDILPIMSPEIETAQAVSNTETSSTPEEEPKEDTHFVSIASPEIEIKRRNLYLLNTLISFIWIFFHFTVVYFFTLKLGSIAMVGLFLGFGNFVSLIMDSPIGVLQKCVPARKLFLASGVMIFCAVLIFLKFMVDASKIDFTSLNGISAAMTFIQHDFMNVTFVVIAAILYGTIKEVNEVTITSYILNNADPSEYAGIMNKNNIYGGAGALIGLLASFIIMMATILALFILLGSIACLIFYLAKYFDSGTDTLTFDKIQDLKLVMQRDNMEKAREYAITQIQKTDFRKVAKGTKYVFLKPMELRKFDWKELIDTTKEEIHSAIHTAIQLPRNMSLTWLIGVIASFAFWDSFVAGFLVPFLEDILQKNSMPQYITPYVVLGIIVIPIFLLQ